MRLAKLLSFAVAFSLFCDWAMAGEVKLEGVHLCCANCVNGAQGVLKGVAGVSNAKASQDDSTIVFTAADDNAVTSAIDALAKAGFRGVGKHGDKAVEFPGSNAPAGSKADSVTITGVHLCCGACYRAAEGALKSVAGVSEVSSDRQAKTIQATGSSVDLNAALESLFKAGFQAAVKN